MFKPTKYQIGTFLKKLTEDFTIKEIEYKDNAVIVTVTTRWNTTDDAGQPEVLHIEDTLELTPGEIDFGTFPADSPGDYLLYEQWLVANNWHPLQTDNPFSHT